LSWQGCQDLKESQAAQGDEEKLFVVGPGGQGPEWGLVEAEGFFPLRGPIWSPRPPPEEGEGACMTEEAGCTRAGSLS